MLSLFAGWRTEKGPSEKTANSWETRVNDFIKFVGHDEADRIEDADAVRWKDSLVARGLSPKTINLGYIAALRVVFAYGKSNRKVRHNPFTDLRALTPRASLGARRKSFSDDDARLLLESARRHRNDAMRWSTFVMAYSGVRIEEIAGANKVDVVMIDGSPFLDLRGDGRQLKNQAAKRRVPLHTAIIDEGFLEYVHGLPDGSVLFPDAKPDRYGKRSSKLSKDLAKWMRKLGITDPKKTAAHSWRHRFADLCRAHGVSKEDRYAIEGHVSDDVGETYGSEGIPPKRLAAVIQKLPVQG